MKKHPYYNQQEDPNKDLKVLAQYVLIITFAAMIILFVVAGLLT